MAEVKDWFKKFAMSLIRRSGRNDFPDPGKVEGKEFWDDFEKSLRRMGASEEQADEATSIVCDMPNLFTNQYRPLIVSTIKKHRSGFGGVVAGSIDEARLVSHECVDCQGSGYVSRIIGSQHEGSFRTVGGNPFCKGDRIVIFCECPLGSMMASLQKPSAKTIDQYPSLRRTAIEEDATPERERLDRDLWDSLDPLVQDSYLDRIKLETPIFCKLSDLVVKSFAIELMLKEINS